mmetsp:Transcript_22626/g.31589  ORF Transcript_22626/g.31589 Transcript_22626/m.31589 type:complete len:157 (+) Transcript_22626:178-648(+)
MKISSDTTAALLSVTLYFMMMMSNVQATDIVRNHRDMLSSLTHDRHLDDNPCVDEVFGFSVCDLQNQICLTGGEDDDDYDDDGIASCEGYDEAVSSFDADFPGCTCFDQYKAALDCSVKQAGLDCDSKSSAVTSSHKSAFLISLMTMAVPFVAIFM